MSFLVALLIFALNGLSLLFAKEKVMFKNGTMCLKCFIQNYFSVFQNKNRTFMCFCHIVQIENCHSLLIIASLYVLASCFRLFVTEVRYLKKRASLKKVSLPTTPTNGTNMNFNWICIIINIHIYIHLSIYLNGQFVEFKWIKYFDFCYVEVYGDDHHSAKCCLFW